MLTLKAGFSQNQRIAPLLDGGVKAQDIELQFELGSPGVMFHKHLKDDAFDVFEMSISEYLVVREKAPPGKWEWEALPIFLSRAFLFLNTRVNAKAEIRGPEDLRGKTFGLPDFAMTAGLWMRAMLKEMYEIGAQDMEWVNGRSPASSHAALVGLDREPPAGIKITFLQEDGLVGGMLERGEIDAGYVDSYAEHPPSPELTRPLFEDGGRSFVQSFFRKTAFTPVNHTLVVQRRILEKDPWVALSLFEGFEKSKQEAYRRARAAQSAYLYFPGDEFDRQAEVYGPDPYPSGLRANRRMLQMAAQESYEEGLTRRPAEIDQLFWETVRDT
jgi:4,5-dihydroxyphthalate decarboxylase